MQPSRTQQVLELVRRVGVLRPRDLDAYGFAREYLIRLHRAGLVNRVGRGLYVAANADITEHQSLAEVARKVPEGVICLLSALEFHELTTQIAHEVWIAIDVKARRPKEGGVPIRVVRSSGDALHAGVEEHAVQGVTVRVYSPAKTVADCFKYRNKIGLDVALEALRDCLGRRKCTTDELWHYAEICRLRNVMRPYLEAVL